MKINDLLRVMCEKDASDIFLKVNRVPCMRIYGEVVPMQDFSASTSMGKRRAATGEFSSSLWVVRAPILSEVLPSSI